MNFYAPQPMGPYFSVNDDPRHEVYLKICYVCQEQAKPGSEHLRNYGGIVCYSCRAFWRRSHQKTKSPNFVCKKGGRCPVTVATRRRCKKCRYVRCLRAGMIPEAVLDEDQKKIRFRKLHQRQRMMMQQQGQSSTSTLAEDQDHDDDEDADEPNEIEVEEVTPSLTIGGNSHHINIQRPLDPPATPQPLDFSMPPPNMPKLVIIPRHEPEFPFVKPYPVAPPNNEINFNRRPRHFFYVPFDREMNQRSKPPDMPQYRPYHLETQSEMYRAPFDPMPKRFRPCQEFYGNEPRSVEQFAAEAPPRPIFLQMNYSPSTNLLAEIKVSLDIADSGKRREQIPQKSVPKEISTLRDENLARKIPQHIKTTIDVVDSGKKQIPPRYVTKEISMPREETLKSKISQQIKITDSGKKPVQENPNSMPRKEAITRTVDLADSSNKPIPQNPICHEIPRPREEPLTRKIPQPFRKTVEALTRGLKISETQSRTAASGLLMKKLDALRTGDMTVEISKRDIFQLISKLSEEFRHFSLLQRSFLMLARPDQRQLLIRNTPLYVQLHIGIYLIDKDDIDSDFASSEKIPMKKFWMKNFLQNLHLQRFNEVTKLFRSGADLDVYARLVHRLKSLPPIDLLEQKSILANSLLFQSDNLALSQSGSDLLDETQVMNEIMFESCIRKSTKDCLSLRSLSKVLVQMALFCAYNIDWTGYIENQNHSPADDLVQKSDKLVPTLNFVITYTREEELWLSQQVKVVNETIRSVSIDDELRKQFFLHSMGEPLPEDHMPKFFKTTMERLFRVAKIHPEFLDLSVPNRNALIETNGPLAMALMILKAENCKNGIEQLQEGFGEDDEVKWRTEYMPFFENPEQMKKNSVMDANMFLPEEEVEFKGHLEAGRILVDDPLLYKLTLLLTLTHLDDSKSPMARTHKRYETMIRRRIEWMTSESNSDRNPNAVETVEDVFSSLKNLQRVSDMLATATLRQMQIN